MKPNMFLPINADVTIGAKNPEVFYVPFVTRYGIVGYRVENRNNGRFTNVYFNPSTDTDGDVPNVFIYVGTEVDPNDDCPITHITLQEVSNDKEIETR